MGQREKSMANAQFWMVVHSWLHACDIKVNKNYLKTEITTHPDYPSLLSVIDFLDTGGMAYKAIHADATYIHSFRYPLLAHIKKPGDEHMHMIANAAEWDQQKEITQHWSGIVVYPEKNARWENEQNSLYRRDEKNNRLAGLGFVAAGIVLIVLSILQYPHFLAGAVGVLSLAGLIFSLFALGTELGFQNDLVKQVCGAVSPGGCEKVLKSTLAKGIWGVTPADVAVLYFGAQFIMCVVGSYQPSYFQSIFLFSFFGIPVAGLSIYLQAVKVKQWCAICLAIVSVLILQGGIALTVLPFTFGGFLPAAIFVALFFVLSMVLFPIKQLIKSNSSNKLKLVELKKWKLDADLFIAQWRQEQGSDTDIWDNDLLIGNALAPILITVACNPYCGPCSKEHKQLDNLLQRASDKVKLQIRLTYNTEDAGDRRTIAARAILQKANTIRNNRELQQMLTDWFEWMDYDKWSEKWRPDNTIDVDLPMKLHSKWMEENRISYTPTSFINGRKLPGKYSLTDVELLIPQLAEILGKEASANHSLNLV